MLLVLTLVACGSRAPDSPVDAAFSEHAAALDTIAALRDQCSAGCAGVLAAATDPARPLAQRETLWWSIAAASLPSAEGASVGETAAGLFAAPDTAEALLWPLARVMLHSGQGALLDAQIREGARPVPQAAAGCAVMSGIPPEYQAQVPLPESARALMGDCAAPWSR